MLGLHRFTPQSPAQREANEYANTIRQQLARLGLCYTTKTKRDSYQQYVEFVEPLIVRPGRVEIEINSRELPRGITIGKISEQDVLDTLSAGCKRTVRAERRGKDGTWFVVELEDYDKIPRRISYKQFAETYPVKAQPLTIPIGQGVNGAHWEDLRKLPHLLIAGATGQGKSVLNNAIITSLISRLPPEDLQIFFADLKGGVEFQVYADLPHIPSRDGHRLVTKAADLPAMLLAIQMEMERRTELMRGKARDLDGYNAHTAAQKQLPYIVVVIDEIASAMLAKERVKLAGGASETVKAATERLLADIAARARATGIHLIISTQRPSVDVITGLIKANFPCRVAFGTSSDVDSRVIVDDSRAQGLPPGRCMFRRNMSLHEYQAPLISESEIEAAVEAAQNGNFLPPPESKEEKARREIAFLIELGIRDLKGNFPIVKLSQHPEVQRAHITETTIRKYHARLKEEGVIGGRFGRQVQRILHPEAYIHIQIQTTEPEIIDADTNSIEPRKPSIDDPDIEDTIRAWAAEGVGRADMHKRIRGGAARIQAVITSTLGSYVKPCHAVATAPEEPQPEATEEEYATAPVDA
jgi:hypothetical protein